MTCPQFSLKSMVACSSPRVPASFKMATGFPAADAALTRRKLEYVESVEPMTTTASARAAKSVERFVTCAGTFSPKKTTEGFTIDEQRGQLGRQNGLQSTTTSASPSGLMANCKPEPSLSISPICGWISASGKNHPSLYAQTAHAPPVSTMPNSDSRSHGASHACQ